MIMGDEQQDPRLPVGVSDFRKLITGKCHFVDKSLLIREIINDSAEVILITRPRRFGKTLNMSMLYYFFQCQHSLNQIYLKILQFHKIKAFVRNIKIGILSYLFLLKVSKKLPTNMLTQP